MNKTTGSIMFSSVLHGALIASCPVAETSTVDTCPWDSNTTAQTDNNVTVSRSTHYTGAEHFCGGYVPDPHKRRVMRDPQSFDTIKEYIDWHTIGLSTRELFAKNKPVLPVFDDEIIIEASQQTRTQILTKK